MINFLEIFLGDSAKWLIYFILGLIVSHFLLKFFDKILSRKLFNIIYFNK